MLLQPHSVNNSIESYNPFVTIRRITVAIRKKTHNVNEPLESDVGFRFL